MSEHDTFDPAAEQYLHDADLAQESALMKQFLEDQKSEEEGREQQSKQQEKQDNSQKDVNKIVVASGDEEWLMENIVDKRFYHGMPEYKVRWKGFSEEHDTWEPLKNLQHCIDAVQEYEAEYAEQEPRERGRKIGQARGRGRGKNRGVNKRGKARGI